MSHSALASLTAQYTDSENEDDASPDSQNSTASQVIIPKKPSPPPTTANKPETVATKPKKKKRPRKMRRLVSYQDDTLISDEDEYQAQESSESSSDSNSAEEESDENKKVGSDTIEGATIEVEDDSNVSNGDERTAESYEKDPKYAKYKFQLPQEPKGKPSPELVAKINKMYAKMKQTNMDMNRVIQDRKEFRNPSIYEKLIQFCEINEFGTNYPPEIYDPLGQWGAESYYEELAAVQKNEMLKRQKDRKEMDKVEQATALARKVEEDAKKRKSKWDQPATSAVIKPTLPALTTTVTGTKGTVISAFGSLPKKPAV